MTDKPNNDAEPARDVLFLHTPPQVAVNRPLLPQQELTEAEEAELRRSSQEAFRLFRQMGKGEPKP